MSILKSTGTGKFLPITVSYLVNTLHLLPINYTRTPFEMGNFSVDYKMGKKGDCISLCNKTFSYTIYINGVSVTKKIHYLWEADLIVKAWREEHHDAKLNMYVKMLNEFDNYLSFDAVIKIQKKKKNLNLLRKRK